MVPAADFFDDGVGVGGPGEGFWVVVGFGEEAVDGGLEVGDAFEDAALQPLPGQLGEEALDGVEPGREVEMERGCRSSQASTLGCLCVA